MGWEVGGLSRVTARWEHEQFFPVPADGALSPELPALGLWGSGALGFQDVARQAVGE